MEGMQGTLCLLFTEYGLYQKSSKQWGLRIYILFWKNLAEFFRFVNLLLENKILPLWFLQNCVTPVQGFNPIFFWQSSLALPGFLGLKLLDFPWLSPEMNYMVHTFFLSLNPRSWIIRLHLPLKYIFLLPHMMSDECALTLHTSWWT